MGKIAPITIRVNPDVDAKTHEKIATGKKENKFGIPIARASQVYAEAALLRGLKIIGIDVHIGSQLTDLEPFEQAYAIVADLARQLRAEGHNIQRLDLGGGLGIPYERSNKAPPLPLEYGEVIRRAIGDLDVEVEIEPGRLISGNAGIMVSEVIYLKSGEERNFLILDAAMNDLIRPSMYGSYHDIVPVVEPAPGTEQAPIDIVGPVCEVRRYLRQTARHAAAGRGRSGRLPLCRGIRRGHGQRVQFPPTDPRGDGAGRSIRCHTRPSDL